jgi:hypothetical protein
MVVRLSNSVRTIALVSLFIATGIVGAALISFWVTDSAARTAQEEMVAFREHAWKEARKKQIYPISPSGYIVSMVSPTISSAERAQIEDLQRSYDSLLFRHALADWLFTRGLLVAVAIAGLCWYLAKKAQPIGTDNAGAAPRRV